MGGFWRRSSIPQEKWIISGLLFLIILASLTKIECGKHLKYKHVKKEEYCSIKYSAISCREHSASITDFGGVGDGETLNTIAFQTAVNCLSQFSSHGGAQLFVPAGKWLTGSFNLTNHFTLYLHKDAVLLASQRSPCLLAPSLRDLDLLRCGFKLGAFG